MCTALELWYVLSATPLFSTQRNGFFRFMEYRVSDGDLLNITTKQNPGTSVPQNAIELK